MTTANDVARHLKRLAAAKPGEPMTATRLHPLLYYCQGWHLAWYGFPLFPDAIEAGDGGPAVPSLDEHANGPDTGGLPTEARESVEQVWSHYRQFSATELREKARSEPPWQAHHRPGQRSEIPAAALAAFFGAEFTRMTGEEPGAMAEVRADVAAGRVTTLDQLRAEWGL